MIQELQDKELELARSLRLVQDRIRSEQLRIIAEKYNVYEGKIIRDEYGETYLIRQIDPSKYTNEPPVIKGNPLKKDGTFAMTVRYVPIWSILTH
jgi:hypothetical protein